MRISKDLLHCGVGFALALVLFLLPFDVVKADADGRSGFSGESGSDCGVCHNGGVVPTVSLSGPTTASAGAEVSYTLSISGGPASVAGFSVFASDGTLINTNAAGARMLDGEVVQSTPTPFSGGSVTYTFNWQAPSTNGTYTLYASGVSADNDAATAGDGSAATTLMVTVEGAANQPPTATISGPATATAGATVSFNGSGSSDPDGAIASYDWDFGDGTAGSGATVTHSFAAGNYTVTLTVTDDGGDTGSTTLDIMVVDAGTQLPPSADAGGPYTGTAGVAVQFDGSGSMDSDGSISAYDWDFGDGSTGTGMSPTHVYAAAGMYTVTLTVTDDSGASGVGQTTVTIAGATGGETPPNEELYDIYCAACHGPGGMGGQYEAVVGESFEEIMEAIEEEPDMAFLATALTNEEIDAIAMYLNGSAGGGAGAGPTPESEDLYIAYCESCHGPGGSGGPDGSVLGESAEDIMEAIVEEPTMMFLSDVLMPEDIDAIAMFLNQGEDEEEEEEEPAPAAPSEELYVANCESCHGPGGAGGPDGPVVGESAADIMEAIAAEPTMMFLADVLTSEDVDAIAAYLASVGTAAQDDEEPASSGGRGGPRPTITAVSPEKLYNMNCGACHGPQGAGGAKDAPIAAATVADINQAIAEEPEMAFLADQLSQGDIATISVYLKDTARVRASATRASLAESPSTSAATRAGSLHWLSLLAGLWLLNRRRRM